MRATFTAQPRMAWQSLALPDGMINLMDTDAPGIQMEVAYFDVDVVELVIRAWNGTFAGATEVWAGHETLAEFAAALSGFPVGPDDRREMELGTFEPRYAGGGVRFCFYCTDASCHATVAISLQTSASGPSGERDTCAFRMPLEAAAIDRFVHRLRHMPMEIGQAAFLEAAST